MKIYAADIVGIKGEIFRLDVGAEEGAQGIGLLGSVQKIIRQGAITRIRHAVKRIHADIDIGANMRMIVDINPPETQLRSSASDLPIAIALMVAWLHHRVEELQAAIDMAEERYAAVPVDDSEARRAAREDVLAAKSDLEAQLEACQAAAANVDAQGQSFLLIGKVNLDGTIEAPDRGVFGMIDSARDGMHVIVPPECEVEAGVIAKSRGDGALRATVASDVLDVWKTVLGLKRGSPCKYSERAINEKVVSRGYVDLRDVEGCVRAKGALEVALAGGHSLMFVGPGGQGKSMLAEAAIDLLPRLTKAEMLEVNRVYSAKGLLRGNELVLRPPFQEAGQSVTPAALMGGGAKAEPGLASLAHRGVLFLDEVNLLDSKMIEDLRTTMQSGVVNVHRVGVSQQLPAKFLFLAAMNPCKCGWYGHYICESCRCVALDSSASCRSCGARNLRPMCKCRKKDVERYALKLSGPIKDRIDMITLVSQSDAYGDGERVYSSKFIRERILRARKLQQARYERLERNSSSSSQSQCVLNGDVRNEAEFRSVVDVPRSAQSALDSLLDRYGVRSLRRRVRLLLMSQTVADLDGASRLRRVDVERAFEVAGVAEGGGVTTLEWLSPRG